MSTIIYTFPSIMKWLKSTILYISYIHYIHNTTHILLSNDEYNDVVEQVVKHLTTHHCPLGSSKARERRNKLVDCPDCGNVVKEKYLRYVGF